MCNSMLYTNAMDKDILMLKPEMFHCNEHSNQSFRFMTRT